MGLSPYLLVLPTTDTLSPPQLTVCAALRRGVVLTSRSRPLVPLDLARFDYVIGMDEKNTRAIKVSWGVIWYWCALLLFLLPPPLPASSHCTVPSPRKLVHTGRHSQVESAPGPCWRPQTFSECCDGGV